MRPLASDLAHPTPAPGADPSVGGLLRHWRAAKRWSQAELAHAAQVSARHLSFVETGRSRPSAELLVSLGIALHLPLRERNRLLLAAGFAPRYRDRPLDAAELASIRSLLQRVVDAHDPWPGLVLDRQWNVLMTNTAGAALAGLLPPFLVEPQLNVFRATLHPEGLARYIANFAELAGSMLLSLRKAIAASGDLGLIALEHEVLGYPNVRALCHEASPTPSPLAPMLVPLVLDLPQGRQSFITTISVFGTPQEVLLEEISVELFYPA